MHYGTAGNDYGTKEICRAFISKLLYESVVPEYRWHRTYCVWAKVWYKKIKVVVPGRNEYYSPMIKIAVPRCAAIELTHFIVPEFNLPSGVVANALYGRRVCCGE